MRKLILLLMLSIPAAFGSVVFNNGDVTVSLSGSTAFVPLTIAVDQWVTTAGPVEPGFLYINDYSGDATDLSGGGSVSIAGDATGYIHNNLLMSAPDEIHYDGYFLIPITFGVPFEIKAEIDLRPAGSNPNYAFDYAGADLTFSVSPVISYYDIRGNVYYTGGPALEASAAPVLTASPEPGTAWLIFGAGAAICGFRLTSSRRLRMT